MRRRQLAALLLLALATLAGAEETKAPGIRVEPESFDFGRALPGKSLRKDFRIRNSALEGIQVFVVACPKDVTMYRDAVKTTGQESRIVVKDLIELVYEAL